MAHRIRNLARPLDAQRERLLALRDSGLNADQASTEVLGQHFVMLEALFQRLASEAMRTVEKGGYRSEERTEGLLRAALKAQRAAVACLSAMKALRDSPTPTAPAKTLGARAPASA